jgi:hypothetical protein
MQTFLSIKTDFFLDDFKKIEDIISLKYLVNIYQTTRRHILEDLFPNSLCRDYLKPDIN